MLIKLKTLPWFMEVLLKMSISHHLQQLVSAKNNTILRKHLALNAHKIQLTEKLDPEDYRAIIHLFTGYLENKIDNDFARKSFSAMKQIFNLTSSLTTKSVPMKSTIR